MLRFLMVFGFLTLFNLTVPAAAMASDSRGHRAGCGPAADAALEELGVAAGDIQSREITASRMGGESNRVLGFLAWYRLKSCRGHVVVNLTPRCRVRQVYGRGGCDLGGRLSTW